MKKIFQYLFIIVTVNLMLNTKADAECKYSKNSYQSNISTPPREVVVLFAGYASLIACLYGLLARMQGNCLVNDIPVTPHQEMLVAMRGMMREEDRQELTDLHKRTGVRLKKASIIFFSVSFICLVTSIGALFY